MFQTVFFLLIVSLRVLMDLPFIRPTDVTVSIRTNVHMFIAPDDRYLMIR